MHVCVMYTQFFVSTCQIELGSSRAIRRILNKSPGFTLFTYCTGLLHQSEGSWSRSISLLFQPSSVADVANSKYPLLIIAKVQLRWHMHLCITALFICRSWLFFFFLVTAQGHLRLYIEQHVVFGISNICCSAVKEP